ncbi:MAG: M56 family metallopeptidase [Polyangiaceae bacterium]|jgi:Zn-dependent protease with chaperone function
MGDLAAIERVAGSLLESFGQEIVGKFGPLNVWTAVLLGSALVLDRALARRARASWRIALYAPIAARILLPLDWSLPFATSSRVATFLAPVAQIGGQAADVALQWHAPLAYSLVALAYLAVVALLATRATLARVRLGRALALATPIPAPRGGISCPVVQHDDLGPMAVGLLAPRIVLPRRLLATGEEHALSCVLRHETAHLRRGDAWLSASMQLLAIFSWPVVPLWIAIGRVRQLVELACDEAALDGADETERRRYGHALLDMAEWPSFAVASLGAGELHFGSTLRARIEALTAQRHWPLIAQALAVSLAPMALLVACGGAAKDYGYEFAPDPAKTAAAAPASSETSHLNKDGRVAPEAIQTTVRGSFGAFKTCYEAGLKRDPKLTGTVNVKSTFGGDGAVKDAADENSTLPDKDVVACVVGEFRKLTFPTGPAGTVTIVYPIQFSP